jgi:hypothetical protein
VADKDHKHSSWSGRAGKDVPKASDSARAVMQGIIFDRLNIFLARDNIMKDFRLEAGFSTRIGLAMDGFGGHCVLTALKHKPACDSSELPLEFIEYLNCCSIKVQGL